MSVTVYGRRNSSSVQLVMWTIGELDIPFERLDYGHGFSSAQSKEFRKKNPMGQIPVLEDAGVCLFESAAILRYLAANYGHNEFWPSDVLERAKLDSWAEWGKNVFTNAVLAVFVYDVRLSPETRNPKILRSAIDALIPLARILDHQVSDKKWIGGDRFTFADIACGHILYRFFSLDWERPEFEHLSSYYDRLKQRPSFCEHVMISYEDLRGSY